MNWCGMICRSGEINYRKAYYIIKKNPIRSSHCGTMGSAASWKHWDAGSLPGLAQGLRIRCCCRCGLGHTCSLDLIPGPGTPHATGQPKKEKEKEKEKSYCLPWHYREYSENFSSPKCGCFPGTKQFRVTSWVSVLTLSTWTQHRSPGVKSSVPQACPRFSHHRSRLLPGLLTCPAVNRRFPDHLLRFD